VAQRPVDAARSKGSTTSPDVGRLAEELLVLDAPGAEGEATTDEAPDAVPGLDERELAVLDFERQWWKHPGSKEQAVREQFDLSPTRYYQLLNALLDREAALRHDPMLVKRLRRARSQRRRTRTARRLGLEP
jgi:hypothetical protein